ncbi:murein biosynthesis integral membrane protein MurJ [Streptomyces sp. XD-27]|uniref:murein biosynthesis integral membrane protein MurJ n=1 Tax=Streptomyces sp. XD-27 TaxID=3062779 RepID=UPI0026F43426|nr:murein biosynthesis integral membrane protein MurJ [Streptomyces sp. XD-27]WKX71509.1 murein biosynthesis integral membrane protein MurJ [Streptomyces sp. XD-27]
MNSPYDGDRVHGPGEDPAGAVPPPHPAPPHPYAPEPHQQDPYLGDPRQVSYSRLPAAHDPYIQDPYVQDPYGTGTFAAYPYQEHDPYAADPLTDARYDRAAHPPPAPDAYQGPTYQQPPAAPHDPDPRVWAPTPAPEPEGPSRNLPYGDDAGTRFTGVDGLVGHAADAQATHAPPQQDAFAHLFRDQQPYEPRRPEQGHYGDGGHPYAPQQTQGPYAQQPYQPGQYQQGQGYPPAPAQGPAPVSAPGPEHVPAQPSGPPAGAPGTAAAASEPAPKRSGGRAANLLQSSALMAAGTLVSRLTGFVRQMMLVAALSAGVLGDAYSVAYMLPAMVYFLTVGGGLNSVFVPQLVRAMKDDDDGGEAFANRLLTLTMVILGGLVVLSVFAAPWLVSGLFPEASRNPAAKEVAVAFARYCLPSIFFMGVHVVVGQILNARGRFGAMMWTPVLNNIVVITTFGLFIWVFGTSNNSMMNESTITAEGLRLLGIGTLLGVTVQALAMFPYLRATGFRFRPRFDWRGKGLGKSAKLAKWTVLFVLANQAGNVVVTRLATSAGADAVNEGHPGTGFLAYSSAQLIWGMPQAIITVSVMAALLPRISRAAHDGDAGAVRDDISQGLRTSAVAIVPLAFGFVALGIPMCTLLFGTSGTGAAQSIGFMLMAFGLGLIPFSVQYVVLRGFYAYEDTRTPFYNTVIVAAVNAGASVACYLVLPSHWAVAGMAASYGLAYAMGVGVAWKRLRVRLGGDLDGRRVVRTYIRLVGASLPAALLAGGAAYAITGALGSGILGSMAALAGGGAVLLIVFYVAASRMRVEELTAMVGMVRGRLGR